MSRKSTNIVPFSKLPSKLSASDAAKNVKQLAADGRVDFVDHAEKRMIKRKVTRTQVIKCLKNGFISEGPFKSSQGNWEMTWEGVSAGQKIGLEIALDLDSDGALILVITVMTRR